MLCSKYMLFFLALPFYTLAFPDTTNIPAKWKNESVIVLEHVHKTDESNYDENARYKETIKMVYYIRDKFGLQQLSTFNIATYIVPGAEMQIGKIYKKNNKIIYLTTRHLIPMSTRIDLNYSKRYATSYQRNEGQKLAIPSLEVGDILEIEYISKRTEQLNYLDAAVYYPTLKLSRSVSVIDPPGGKVTLMYKPVNMAAEQIETSDHELTITRTNVERLSQETLGDDKKTHPYVIFWKHYTSDFASTSFDNIKSPPLLELKGKALDEEYEKINNILFKGWAEPANKTAQNLIKVLDKDYPTITDTISYLNSLYYYCREMTSVKCLTSENANNTPYDDNHFTRAITTVLSKKKIPYKVFITHEDYFGAPNSLNEIAYPKFGIYIEQLDYFMFDPFLSSEPNLVPPYFEGQSFVAFPIMTTKERKKDNNSAKFGFFHGTFPYSESSQNLIHSDITIGDIDVKKQNCKVNLKVTYTGNAKSRFTKRICSKTYLYELAANPYREKILKNLIYVDQLKSDSVKHLKYLKKFVLDDITNEGYEPLNLGKIDVDTFNFFDNDKPAIKNYEFELKDFFIAYDKYIIFNAGKLLGSQLAYVTKDSIRQHDIFIPYRKKYSYTIHVKVPENYTVENLQDFNTSYKSGGGKFESTATLNGNVIEIRTEKDYNFTTYSKTEDNYVKSFLESAIEFTQKKLLFKKI